MQKLFKNLASTATAAAATPADPASQNAFSAAADETIKASKSASANTAPLSLRKAIDRLGLTHLVGESMETRLRGILSRTPFLLTQASEAITGLRHQLEKDLEGKVTQGIALLEQLEIEPLQADSSLAEVGILLPTSVVNDDLIAINKNLRQWERVVRNFAELTAGKAPSAVKLAAVSSGSFELYLSIDPEIAKTIGEVVLSLVGGFIALYRARQRRGEMETDHYPSKVIEGAKEHEDQLLNITVDAAAKAALDRAASSLPTTRVNELKAAIKIDVHFIAKSISNGVDVQVSPPQLEEQEHAPQATVAVMTELRELGQRINALTRSLSDRKAPLAELPESIEQEDTEQKPSIRPKREKA